VSIDACVTSGSSHLESPSSGYHIVHLLIRCAGHANEIAKLREGDAVEVEREVFKTVLDLDSRVVLTVME
jgi:hypothetical protein